MKPEDRAVEECHRRRERIVPAHMLLLVREYSRELGTIPRGPVRRQNDLGRDQADGHRRRARWMRQSSLVANRIAADRPRASPSDAEPHEKQYRTPEIHRNDDD